MTRSKKRALSLVIALAIMLATTVIAMATTYVHVPGGGTNSLYQAFPGTLSAGRGASWSFSINPSVIGEAGAYYDNTGHPNAPVIPPKSTAQYGTYFYFYNMSNNSTQLSYDMIIL
jgi:hypothetical protein